MTPEQAQLTQTAAAAIAAHLRGDEADRNELLMNDGRLGDTVDGLVHLSIAVSELLAALRGGDPMSALDGFAVTDEGLLPLDPDAAQARRLVRSVHAGEQPDVTFDKPTALTSMFNLTLAGFRQLDGVQGLTAEQWASQLALGAARET